MGSIASAVGGVVGSIGGMISGNKAADAANQQAEYLRNLSAEQRQAILDATQSAQERGQFKPVTVTSSFGTPQYTYDESGRLTGVAAQPASWLANLQARQQALAPQYMGLTEGALSAAPQFEQATQRAFGAGGTVYDLAQQAAAQQQGLYGIGQEMYGLGRGLAGTAQQAGATGQTLQQTGADIYGRAAQALPTSYDTAQATQDYYNRMQQMVAPQREQQLAQTRQSLFNTGRTGLATGATQAGGMLATNPEMAAYYNALAQQDLQLANQAEQQALANLAQRTNIGQGLYQTGLQQYQAGLGAQQQGVGTTQAMANILGQGIGATQAGLGAGSTAAQLYGSGTGLFGMAGDLQNQLYRNVAASQAPFAAGMQAVTGLEESAFSPVARGFQYASPVTSAEQWAGEIGLRGTQGAASAATQFAPQIAGYQYQNSSYSPWGSLLQGVGSSLGQSNMGSWSSLFGGRGPVGPQISNAAYNAQDAYAARLNAAEGF
jgi:YD repeat-containing protein